VPEHLEALHRLGPTVHHRRLFAPVMAARLRREAQPLDTGVIALETPIAAEISPAI